MACILPFNGKTPRIGKGAFIAPTATLIGDVEIGDGASVWFGAVLRGDEAAIHIGDHTSVQDNVVIHVYEGHDTVIADHVTVGHGAILEACHIDSYALIGMNAVVLDRAKIGARAVIAAGAVVLEDQEIPSECMAAGAPAKVKKKLEGSRPRGSTSQPAPTSGSPPTIGVKAWASSRSSSSARISRARTVPAIGSALCLRS